MVKLEEIQPNSALRGITPNAAVTVISVQWYGDDAIELTYKDAAGRADNQLLFRDAESRLELVTEGRPWSFEADGALLRLASEAQRIQLAYLFDPYLAVHTSVIDPLPHQITAVYESMLPRQPLRFLLADDPGSGKTIMAGLYIKELMIRGDLQRCLVVCPGNLAEQWQDELWQRFQLPFELLTNDRIRSARTGNAFAETPLLIARLDKLARNDDLQEQLAQVDWDLAVVDEAHKMSATFFGGEVKYTKRYRLGQRLSQSARHFLLMTATPHNGKEEDFQLFMALLDQDRFEGRFREGVYSVDVSDLMRRMVKEQLLTFDAKPLFPERRAYTLPYRLSRREEQLYEEVTEYVREEFNRAERLENGGRRGAIGFALTILQRRLASSPQAIHSSLQRRRERLEKRLQAMEAISQGVRGGPSAGEISFADLNEETIDDLQDLPADELEALEEEVIDRATAARSADELRMEILTLQRLERLAREVLDSGVDRKWDELSALLQDDEAMFDKDGYRHKLVIFTEHRDTLSYLVRRIRTLLGRPEAVVEIHGGVDRKERRRVQDRFTQERDVVVLVATDAAGEGINLQRAHLMINYDLPWNPNRIEQRFGRIHRIGQTEVCHLWNLVAEETREGDVYLTLLHKLDRERETLGGAVFDVLGKAIDGAELRKLMLEAIRYGDRPEVRARLTQQVEGALDAGRLKTLIEEQALAHEMMDASQVYAIRQQMERMEALRLQPHFIATFFKAAFQHLGGSLRQREPGRYQIRHVPAVIRQRGQALGQGRQVLRAYERICFEKERRQLPGKPTADFVAPGHPLLDATLDLILERHRPVLTQGALLVDESDRGEQVRALFYLEHAVQDAEINPDGGRRVVSRKLQFVEIPLLPEEDGSGETGAARNAGPAPYLDYRPLDEEEKSLVAPLVERLRSTQALERRALGYAVAHIAPRHMAEVRERREPLIDKTVAAVKERLTKEIIYWNNRAMILQMQEEAGRTNARLNSARARQRAEELEVRLQRRLEELERSRQLAASPPAVIGGALVIPAGLLERLKGERRSRPDRFARETTRVEREAMAAVMAAERALGHTPRDVGSENLGYDVESVIPGQGGQERLRFIEVKGRIQGAATVTVTRNEILTGLNKPDDWLLALVEVPPLEETPADVTMAMTRESGSDYYTGAGCRVRYLRQPFERQPDFDAVSVNYGWSQLWSRGVPPEKFEATFLEHTQA